jgi:membrane-bound ClpP family serine protease
LFYEQDQEYALNGFACGLIIGGAITLICLVEVFMSNFGVAIFVGFICGIVFALSVVMISMEFIS